MIDFTSFLRRHILYKLIQYSSTAIYNPLFENILEMKILELSPSKKYVKIEYIPGDKTEWWDIEKLSKSIEIVEVLNDNRAKYE